MPGSVTYSLAPPYCSVVLVTVPPFQHARLSSHGTLHKALPTGLEPLVFSPSFRTCSWGSRKLRIRPLDTRDRSTKSACDPASQHPGQPSRWTRPKALTPCSAKGVLSVSQNDTRLLKYAYRPQTKARRRTRGSLLLLEEFETRWPLF